ncbi:MAG: response regulator [Candidatus Sericytochromatia bacterium]
MKQSISSLLQKSPRILVVDDDIENLAEMVGWLSHRDGQLYQARSTEQAQTILRKEWVDAVITDWQLPGLSGLELIRALRSQQFAGPLLLCTGMMLSAEHLQMAFAAGANDYLRKPLNRVELNARLDSALQLHAQSETLRLLNQSQERFIQFLSQDLGGKIQHLRQLQQVAPDTARPLQLTEAMGVDFQAMMEWGRYRFALQHVQFQRFELKRLLKDLETYFAAQWHRVILRGGKDVFLHTDPDLLRRILIQLLDNALRYTQGNVGIKVSVAEHEVVLNVWDDGEGLSEGELLRLLEPAHQGLGLLICTDLLALLNSQLQARRSRSGENNLGFALRA